MANGLVFMLKKNGSGKVDLLIEISAKLICISDHMIVCTIRGRSWNRIKVWDFFGLRKGTSPLLRTMRSVVILNVNYFGDDGNLLSRGH